jgi:hypothetical protein
MTANAIEDQEAARLIRINGELVEELAQVACYDANGLAAGPMTLYRVLERDAWRRYAHPRTKVIYEPADFPTFVVAEWPNGLGVKGGIPALLRMCEGDGEYAVKARTLIKTLTPAAGPEEGGAPVGNKNAAKGKPKDNVHNVHVDSRPHGNNETYLLRRLKRDRPDLAAKVVAGEMSAHAAGKAAGFVKATIQIQPTVPGFLKAAQAHLSPEQRLELKEAL